MILQALNTYYDRLLTKEKSKIPAFGFARQKIHFCMVLSPSGNLVDVQDLRTSDGKRIVPLELVVPEPVKRTVAIAPNFLWDNTRYVLGADRGENPTRAQKAFEAFKRLHHAIGDRVDDLGMAAVLIFIDNWIPEKAHELRYWQEMAGQNLVFRLEGEHHYVHEHAILQKAWSDHYSQSDENVSAVCLINGTQAPIARLHPAIKGVTGAQSSGAALISFNLDAFTSHGKSQNYNAPIGEEGAFGYTTALNWLLRNGSRQKMRIGDATVVFWAERKTLAETLLAELLDPKFVTDMEDLNQETPLRNLRIILEAARKGRIQDVVDEPNVPFYILGLSPNASRISVRFWHVSTAGDIVAKIGLHFDDMAIVKNFANTPDFPSVWRLLKETAAQGKNDNVSPLLAGALMRSILTGAPYPQNLLAAILMRIRADHTINTLRASLIKACLVRNYNHREVNVSLDKGNTNIGYRLGRLFAVLERIQERANPNITSTIRDKYFGSAAATPRNIFPMLISLSQQHIGKLRRDGERKGLTIFFDRMIGEILEAVDAVPMPAYLDPEKQGLFTLGYYHQRQDFFAKKDETNEEE